MITSNKGWGNRLVMGVLLVIPGLVLAAAIILDGDVTYNRWDNFDYFMPQIFEAHSRLLEGDFPHINRFQFMGEPVLAALQPGVLYPGYTLCVAVVRCLGLSPLALIGMIAVVHTVIFSAGMYRFLRAFSVQAFIALAAAYSASMSGYFLYMGSKWIFTLVIISWVPWGLYFLKQLMDTTGRQPMNMVCCAAVLLFQVFVGYPQLTLYAFLSYAVFILVYGIGGKVGLRVWLFLAVFMCTVLLMSMPLLLPAYELMKMSSRASMLPYGIFAHRPVNPKSLLALLWPLFRGWDYFSELKWLATTYMGGWGVPAVISMLVIGIRRRCVDRSAGAMNLRPALLAFGAACITALFFILFSLGDYGLLLRLTYGLPVWSNFRWPFKFFGVVVPYGVAAGALALDLIIRLKACRSLAWCCGVCAVFALLIWFFRPAQDVTFAPALALLALIVIVGLPFMIAGGLRWLLPAVVLILMTTLMLSMHFPGRLMSFVPMYRGFDAESLGMDAGYRIFPISDRRDDEIHMHELCLYQAASMNRYCSLTGCIVGITPSAFTDFIPGLASGAMAWDIPYRRKLLNSHLLRAMNTRYIRVAKDDQAAIATMKSLPGYDFVGDTERAETYANSNALPLVYFASRIVPYSEKEFRDGLLDNSASLTTAYVDGLLEAEDMSPGRVVDYDDQHEKVSVEVCVPEDGFLVVGRSYFPGWEAQIDGRMVSVHRVNAMISGVFVSAGSKKVEFVYRSRPFIHGVYCFTSGFLLLMLLAFGCHGRRRACA